MNYALPLQRRNTCNTCMTDLDQQRVAEWIGDAFAILCVRVGSVSKAETNLRLGFEAILRQLGTSPLRLVASRPPPSTRTPATAADFRVIRKALDSCLAVFRRYDALLSGPQRQVQSLVMSTRDFVEQELEAREKQNALNHEHAVLAA